MALTMSSGTIEDQSEAVLLRVPADAAYLAVLRTAAAGLAARVGLTLDQIEDLRIAVDEAAALLMTRDARPGAELTASFRILPDAVDVTMSGPATQLTDPATFAWSVLDALVSRVETGTSAHGSWIRLIHGGGRRA